LSLSFPGVSRTHARLVLTPGDEWAIEDLGSRNGTLLNGQRLERPEVIRAGDVITVSKVSVFVGASPDPKGSGQVLEDTETIVGKADDLSRDWMASGAGVDQRAESRAERLLDLVEIAKELNMAVSIDSIFDRVKKVAFRYLSSVERLALLVDATGDGRLLLQNWTTRGTKTQIDVGDDDSWISQSICRKAFEERLSIQTSDAQSDTRFEEEASVRAKGIRSAMAVPLWNEDVVVGVLYADGHVSTEKWVNRGQEDLSFFSSLANLVATSVQRWALSEKLREEGAIRHRLERYHSPAVVQHLIELGESREGRLHPQEYEITVLFCDIVGFTSLSETLTPGEVMEMLNVFFEEMLGEVFAAGGTLDKFNGDGLMAFFGAPNAMPDHASRAVTSAEAMLSRLEGLNARSAFPRPLEMRIAINSGKAVVGDVGSPQRVDYTALGSTVNLASRMEAICPPNGCVISEHTHSLLGDPSPWIDLGEHAFRGIRKPVRIFGVS
jgi:adenylate cyclase